MQKSSFISLSSAVVSLLLLSACGSDTESSTPAVKTPQTSSYYITPLNIYDTQANLGESDVGSLGNLRQSSQNPLHTGLDTVNLEMKYDSQESSDNLNSLGKWRHSFSKSMDRYKSIDYDALDIKSEMYASKEDVCLSGFESIKEQAFNQALKDTTASFDKESDTCAITNAQGSVVLRLPIFSPDAKQLFHTLTREDGETLVFIPSLDGGFESTTDKRFRLSEESGEWKLVTSDDKIEMYDADGKLQSVRTGGLKVSLEYEDDNLVKINDAFGEFVSLEYDKEGFLESVKNSKDEIVNHFDIEKGKLQEVYLSKKDELLELFKVKYEEKDKLSELKYATGDVKFSYTYNANGKVVTKSVSDNNGDILDKTTYSYTPQALTITDEQNNTTEITFEMIASSLKTLSVTNSVDGNSSEVTLSYDKQGFLEKLQSSDFFAKIEHNLRGLITSIVSDDNTSVEYAYDETHNRPTQIKQGDDIQTLVYNKFGSIIASLKEKYNEFISSAPTRQNTMMTRYSYDENGRLLSIKPAFSPSRGFFDFFSFDEEESLKPSIFDDNYETLISSWNLDFNEAKPHSEKYYKNSNAKYYDWIDVDKPKFEEQLKDKKYIFIGYSYGADSVLELSTRDLSATPNFEIDLLITIDPVGWIPTFEPDAKEWINVTAKASVKTLSSGRFKYVGRKWGIPQYKWVKTTKSIPKLDASDVIASAGGKKTYAPLVDAAGKDHEQINYTGHHLDFNCMLGEISNRYPEIGLFKVNAEDTRAGEIVEGCYMGSGSITLVD